LAAIMGAHMIAPDIRAALDRIALIARMAAMSDTIPEARHNLSRLSHALQALGEAAERVESLEASPVPVWWMHQPSDPREWPGNVVAIRGQR
jgi:ribosomal protein S12 methylthiotransferase accessory factor YcaO